MPSRRPRRSHLRRELALIRWLGANVVHLSYFSNFVLLGSFLGIGAGFLVSRKSWSIWPVFLPLLPAGLHGLLQDLGVRLVEVPEAEYATLGCNVLAVRPGVALVADGNPVTRRGLQAAGCEVHVVPLDEVGGNGSGGVTCLMRPILRG